jgi:hypothetical protein
MIITKTFSPTTRLGQPSAADLETINRLFALEPVGEDDVRVLTMHVANDQFDRSHERFPEAVLQRFADTISGKPILTGHDRTQVPRGRFISGDVVPQTDGSNHLIARAYLDAADPLVQQVARGIAKDVSIGAAADRRVCTLCERDHDGVSKDGKRCEHRLGETYDGKVARAEWGGDLDKYEVHETSFVYLGCQPGAQVLANNSPTGHVTKTALPGGTIILDYGAPDIPAPQGDGMTLEQALEKITTLETEISALKKTEAENEPLVTAGKEYLEVLKTEAVTKSGVLGEAEKTQTVALLGSVETPNLPLIKAIHGSVMARFDKEFPPAPIGQARDVTKEEKPARFDPVAGSPFRRSA